MKHYKKFIFLVVLFLLLIMGIRHGLYISSHSVVTNVYKWQTAHFQNPVKLLIVSDLHDDTFGENDQELISKLTKQHPDAILMLGDMLNSYSDHAEHIIDLVKEASEIAPVYYALGNHELSWMESHEEDLEADLEEAGAVVLNREYCDVVLNGQPFRIGGLYDYAFGLQELEVSEETNERVQVYRFLKEFEDTDAFKIMLSHRPDSFIFGDASEVWDIDLVASGHLHGGQVVIPLFGGVYGGDQGLFPEYVHGLYEKDKMQILVTSGLSTNKKAVPRFNNPPEISVLEFITE